MNTHTYSQVGKISALVGNKEYVQAVNKTYRGKGAVGKNALVPRVVEQFANKKKDVILDYGAGPDAYHAKALRKKGYDVVAYDIGANHKLKNHLSEQQLTDTYHTYDIVYASNVFNVQPNEKAINTLLSELHLLIHDQGMVILNYPKSPRHSPFIGTDNMKGWLQEYFQYITQVAGTKQSPVWMCTNYKPTFTPLLKKG